MQLTILYFHAFRICKYTSVAFPLKIFIGFNSDHIGTLSAVDFVYYLVSYLGKDDIRRKSNTIVKSRWNWPIPTIAMWGWNWWNRFTALQGAVNAKNSELTNKPQQTKAVLAVYSVTRNAKIFFPVENNIRLAKFRPIQLFACVF